MKCHKPGDNIKTASTKKKARKADQQSLFISYTQLPGMHINRMKVTHLQLAEF